MQGYCVKFLLQALFDWVFARSGLHVCAKGLLCDNLSPYGLDQTNKKAMRMIFKALTTITALLMAQSAAAQVLSSGGGDPYRAQLIGAGPQSDNRQLAGVMISLEPGWKTYWRTPGEGGIAPRFDWSRSKNLKSVAYIWPSPQIFDAYGSVTIGYEGDFVLPVMMQAIDPSQPIEAHLDMAFGVCSDLCIPAQTTIGADLFEADAINAVTLEASIEQSAISADQAGLQSATCTIVHKDGDDFEFNAELNFKSARKGRQLLVVETGNEDIWVSRTDTEVDGGQVVSQADLVNYADGPLAVSRDQLRLTLIGGSRAVDIRGCTG